MENMAAIYSGSIFYIRLIIMATMEQKIEGVGFVNLRRTISFFNKGI